jgi:glycosyltransferase involved in cell wall biosynthesis
MVSEGDPKVGPTPAPERLPSLGIVLTVFHRGRFYREALAAILGQTGALPGVQVVVVRSPDVQIVVPDGFKTRGWNCEVVESDAVGEGPFFEEGLRRLRSEVVVPLDDDDAWQPGRLAAVAEGFRASSRVGYYHNGQSFVDGNGAPVSGRFGLRHLRRFSGVPTGRTRIVSTDDLRRHPGSLAEWGSVFNNSSVAIRRRPLVEAAEHLRATTWLLDTFLFYVAASSGSELMFDPAPRTIYRIHSWNKSRGPQTPGPSGAPEPSQSRQGRLASMATIREMVRHAGAAWLEPWVDRDIAYLEVLEGVREGDPDRVRAFRKATRLVRYARYNDPVMNGILALTALGQAVAPGMVGRAYWSRGSATVGEGE